MNYPIAVDVSTAHGYHQPNRQRYYLPLPGIKPIVCPCQFGRSQESNVMTKLRGDEGRSMNKKLVSHLDRE